MDVKRKNRNFHLIILTLIAIFLVIPMATSINLMDYLGDLSWITGRASSATHTVSLSITNNAPAIANVTLPSIAWSITGDGTTKLHFSFIATDPDGVANLNDTIGSPRGAINFTLGPETVSEQNSSCTYISDVGGTANYSCEIPIYYWYMNGTWTINVSVCDINYACAQNVTRNFSLGVTPAMTITPAAINFGNLALGATNSTATDDPITITNTGNQNITLGNVRIKGIDLAGTTDGKTLGAGNFTVGTGSGSGNDECVTTNSSTQLVNNTATGIARAGLPRGNFSLSSTTANEKLFYCLRNAPLYLPIQDYNTNLGGAWTINII